MKRTRLHIAVIEQQTEIVSDLITSKDAVILNAKDSNDKTALDYAIQSSNLQIIKLLLDAGAKIFNYSIQRAVESIKIDILTLLLDKVASGNSDDNSYSVQTVFESAVSYGNSNIVKLLFNTEAAAKLMDDDKKYLLHEAIKTQNLNVVKLILDFGVHVEAANEFGNTPIHLAVESKSLDILQLLLDCKANVNVKNKHGLTPLHLATKLENDIVGDCTNIDKLLLEAGADVKVGDNHGNTSLHLAVKQKNKSINTIQLLVDHGADIDAQNFFLTTPLHYAVYNSNYYASRMLLEAGADVNLADQDGETPLHLPAAYNNLDFVKLLLEYGADLNSSSEYQQTPFMLFVQTSYMTQKDRIEAFKLFLEYSDVNLVDAAGKNILSDILESDDYAAKRNLFYKYILEHVAKVKVLNKRVDSSLLDTISRKSADSDYFNKCIKELENAKSTKLNNCHISFLNLLVDDESKFIKYAGNQDLVEDSENRVEKFPIYGPTMQRNLAQGIESRKLFDGAADFLSYHLPILNPTHLIIRDTLDTLRVEDWKKLCEKKRAREE